MENNELKHWGLKGMKWGRRRYQNEDGTLTEAGKLRYARDAKEKGYSKYDESTGKYYKTSKNNGREDLEADANRYDKEDKERTKKLVDETATMTNKLKNISDSGKNEKIKLDLSNMSDKQMRDEINRALLERQYSDLFASPTAAARGKQTASKIFEGIGATLGVASSALGIALAIKELRGK